MASPKDKLKAQAGGKRIVIGETTDQKTQATSRRDFTAEQLKKEQDDRDKAAASASAAISAMFKKDGAKMSSITGRFFGIPGDVADGDLAAMQQYVLNRISEDPAATAEWVSKIERAFKGES